MIGRGSDSEVNVISLVGERGRELREFIENDLGPEGMKKTVIVVSTSDQPAPMRIRAATLATALSEGFRDAGKKVLLLMDSLTDLQWHREKLALLLENLQPVEGMYLCFLCSSKTSRTGSLESGSITAIYTVLVEGDDMNEPVADAVRVFLMVTSYWIATWQTPITSQL